MSFLPKPPIRNMTDFVVFAFVTIVVIVLTLGMVTAVVLAVKGRDLGSLPSIFADITTSLISALIGFLAGKGQGRTEVHEELHELSQEEKQE